MTRSVDASKEPPARTRRLPSRLPQWHDVLLKQHRQDKNPKLDGEIGSGKSSGDIVKLRGMMLASLIILWGILINPDSFLQEMAQ